jgi:aminoglycoside phosphotransferase (APT) family kinase protein
MTADLIPADRLATWLDRQELSLPEPLRIEQLSGGSSNLTFRVRSGAYDWVLRRPPARGALPTAHDVLREYHFMQSLGGTAVPVPEMVRSCADETVIGVPFYLMERLDGVIYGGPDAVRDLSPERARDVAFDLVDALAGLHAVDPLTIGLDDLARPEPFLDRQIRRWAGQWERAKTRDVPLLDEQFERLRHARPDGNPCRIVHGDYNLANVMYRHEDPARIIAILDWELSALGDPLADVGALMAYWGAAGRLLSERRGGHLRDAQPAFPDTDALIDRYAATSGQPVDNVAYYELLATVKLAVICAGALHRMTDDQQDQRANIVTLVGRLAEVADALPVKT